MTGAGRQPVARKRSGGLRSAPMILVPELLALLAGAFVLAWLVKRAKLPPLLGMIAAGVALRALWPSAAEPGYHLGAISSPIRFGVLAIVLLRAGLGLAPRDLRRAGGLALRLGLIPMLCDAAAVAGAGMLLLDLPPAPAAVLGFLVAAISPAIVIPGLLDLLERLDGRARRAPTAMLAGAPLDNIAAVVALGIALEIALSGEVAWSQLALDLPWTILGGVAVGLGVGAALGFIFRRWPSFGGAWAGAATLWAAAMGITWAGQQTGFSFVLAIIALGSTARAIAPQAGSSLAELLRGAWNAAQYALFGLIGFAVDLDPLAEVGLASLAVIALGQLGRAAGSFVASGWADLSARERLACALSYTPKATIQAAFASLALDRGLPEGGVILSVGVLAIVATAPLGVVALHRGAGALLGACDASPEGLDAPLSGRR